MISIITPSYNMFPYLQRAAASVADQSYEDVEHIIMDGGSDDGSAAWLKSPPFGHISGVSQKDAGMYDAVNQGLARAGGDILAYLNCDEQYLPGTLEFVADFFRQNPQVDILFGDALLIRPDGGLIAYRKGYRPRWSFIAASHLYVLSCTMFFRKRIVTQGFAFDTAYRAVGDMDFVIRLLKSGFKARHVKKYFSAFTMTGNNLSTDARAIEEQGLLFEAAPVWVKRGKLILNVLRFGAKFLSGAYFQGGPIGYDVYTNDNMQMQEGVLRTHFDVVRASFRWKFQ